MLRPQNGTSAPGRVSSLDGLRGIAAGVVVIHHTLLIAPPLADAYLPDPPDADGLTWYLTRTPAHLFWAGSEAVSVFFVLSGYVLWLQMCGMDWRRWFAYYPRRLTQLYLPVIGAVALATALAIAVTRSHNSMFSWWMNTHVLPSFNDLVRNLSLVFGTTSLDSPLWSLRVEVFFSLLLPLYGLGLRSGRLPWWLSSVGLLGLNYAGRASGHMLIAYLSIFGFGVLLADRRESLHVLVRRLTTRAWIAFVVIALTLLNSTWTPWTLNSLPLAVLNSVGAAMLVTAFVHCPAAVRLGDSRVAQMLGLVSFSLYLIHEPVIVTSAFLLQTTNPLWVATIALPGTVILTYALWRCGEKPAIILSRWVGRSVRQVLSRRRDWTRDLTTLGTEQA
jgi:peptidoglycan/LPS O-acetylase OafA/YrhL